jgi:acetyltransferase
MAALGDFFSGLSAQTRYLRFFAPVTPTPAMLRVLSGGGAHVDALVAIRDGVIIGHAMAAGQPATEGPPSPGAAARDPQQPGVADIGVVVADAWQGRGVGSALVRELVTRAQARGVRSVTMDVLHANHTVLAMIERRWPAADIGHCRESAAIHVQLPRPEQPPSPRQAPRTVTGQASLGYRPPHARRKQGNAVCGLG